MAGIPAVSVLVYQFLSMASQLLLAMALWSVLTWEAMPTLKKPITRRFRWVVAVRVGPGIAIVARIVRIFAIWTGISYSLSREKLISY